MVSSDDGGKPAAVHFGAGNIGRGFIGALLAESGYHVVFSDVDKKTIDELNAKPSYPVKVVFANGREHEVHITDFAGVMSSEDEVVDYIALPDTRIITTAVGPAVLPKIAPTIARGLRARRDAGAPALNIIGCENMVHQTDELKKHVEEHLDDDLRAYCAKHVGFANCSVDRIVPGGGDDDSEILAVTVEDFLEWVVDKTALVAPVDPPIKHLTLTDKLDAYIERKLFTLNCGHATVAYLGFVRGIEKIHEAISQKDIYNYTRAALQEGGAALVRKHGFDEKEHSEYIEKILKRFANPALGDPVARVGKQPLRKLGRRDRLLGPIYMARLYDLPIDNLCRSVAAAFLFDLKEDEESVELQEKVQKIGIEDAVVTITGFEKGTREFEAVVKAYNELKK
ncbi:unnamed protein product [Peniophora sp. CBMAI 1063]|nr:unnamed protein product [Peniophora sp. CBMAI 1063]